MTVAEADEIDNATYPWEAAEAAAEAIHDTAYQAAAIEASTMTYDEILIASHDAQEAVEDAFWGQPTGPEVLGQTWSIEGPRSYGDQWGVWYLAGGHGEFVYDPTPQTTALSLPACRELVGADDDQLARLRGRRDALEVAADSWDRFIDANTPYQDIEYSLRQWAITVQKDVDAMPVMDPPDSFPRRLFAVPGFISQVIEYNLQAAYRPQPILALAGAICLQAALCGRKVRDEYGTRPNVQIISVVGTSLGKEFARGVNSDILTYAGAEKLLGAEEVASDAGLFRMLADHPVKLWQLDEFGRFLKTTTSAAKSPHLYAIPSALMRLFTSAGKLFLPKAYGDSKMNVSIDQPCLVLHATSTPSTLFSALSSDNVADGFLGRCLIFEGIDNPVRQMMKQSPPPADILAIAKYWFGYAAGGNIADVHPVPSVIPTTPEAAERFDQLAESVDENYATSVLWGRVEEKSRQLAIVYACSACHRDPVIDLAAADWACDLAWFLTQQMVVRVSQWVSSSQHEADGQRLLRIIRDRGGRISGTDLCRATQWLKPRERKELLLTLYEGRFLRTVEEQTASKTRTWIEIIQ